MINLLTKSLTLFILLTSLYLNGQIRIDGQFDDWTQITTTDDSGDGFDIDIESVSITNNAIDLFIKVTLNQEIDLLDSENLAIFIDADNNSETGFPVNGIGSEISYYFGDRNGFINFPDEFINVNHSILGIIPAPTVTSNTFEFSVNRGFQNDIGPMSLGAQISIVISNAVDGGDSVPNDEGGILYQWDYQNAEDIPYSLDKQEDNFRLLSYNVENSSFFNEENGPIQQKLLTLAQPDIIAFQEMIESDTEAETVLNQLWDNDEDWLCTSYGFDTKLCLQGIEFEAGTSIDGNTANLLIFDDGSELIVINAHLPCCDKDEERQGEIDHILARIRDGEYGFLAQENTPVVIIGDLNLVGLAQNITSLTNGDIVDEASYGSDFTPDHNGSNYIDAAPTCTGIPYSYTWNNPGGSYAPGRLDFIIYGGDYLKLTNSLVMATEGFTASDRFNNNILRTDSQNASDHYPILADFTFNIDEDGDGFTYQEDCNDNDSSINPDADDIPNNELDEDCDGVALQIDEDEDGYNSDEDCDDTVAAVNPDAVEIPNDGIDNNCDGNIDETYLEFPYEGWKQVINSSFWTGWETREFVSTYEYNNAESFNWENGILVLEGFDTEPDRLICDFTLKVGDNVDLEAFGNPKTYSVTEKYRTLNLVQDSVWYLELIPLESSSPTDTLRWMEGVGDLATGIFRHSAGFEGGTSHACTLDSLNRRIGVNLNYYSTCDCDNFLGVDEDNDGFSNHVGASSVIGTSSLSPLHLSHFKTRTCDTLSIEVHFDNIESPMLSLDESCGEIIEQDEIIYDQTGIPIATYLYFELPEVETLYFFDQCILLAEIKVLNCIETDCDDTNPDVNPDTVEIPNNGMDDDCDGEELIMIDEDGDGFNSDEDCDDTDADINPDASEIVNNDIDEDCDGIALIIDEDFDGFNSDEDCDDNNPDVNPDAPEIPNNEVDENCDGEILIIDEDEDGFNSDEDCDDDNPDVNPDAEEIPNNEMDEDCDGIALIIDDDFDGFNSDDDCDDMNPDINPDASEIVNNDIDEDCDGEALIIDEDGDGFHSDQDCDDNNTAINPGAIEVPYNGIDEDCDPTTLDDDLDQDGFNLDEDCNDINTNINPGAIEVPYNGIDDDCDPTTLDDDLDQDGFTLSEDCDDNTADVNPDANEITYNGIDDDCDLTTLDDDLDQDGFNSDEDCDDNNADVNPDATEIANNAIDEDCDGEALETYFDFLQIGWRQGYELRVGDGGGGVSSSIRNHYISRDTIISDTTYKVVILEGYENFDRWLLYFDNGKIYYKQSTTLQNRLLLDFTGNIGDTISTYLNGTLIVESRELTELLNGQVVHRIGLREFNHEPGSVSTFWLEGVGYENSGLQRSITFEDGGTFHICTSQEDIVLFDESIVEVADCDYIIDSYTLDSDGDGFFLAQDCDDNIPEINPDAIEVCDDSDNNCDGNIDEGLEFVVYYIDNDMDGYGVEGQGTESCLQPPDTTTEFGDCDDSDPLINPDAEDIPNNGIDEDCDGQDAVSSITEPTTFSYSVYPNPTTDDINVLIESVETIQVELFDLSGKGYQTVDCVNGVNPIKVADLPSGVYFFKLSNETESTLHRIVKL